jgi:hypothetical protein
MTILPEPDNIVIWRQNYFGVLVQPKMALPTDRPRIYRSEIFIKYHVTFIILKKIIIFYSKPVNITGFDGTFLRNQVTTKIFEGVHIGK